MKSGFQKKKLVYFQYFCGLHIMCSDSDLGNSLFFLPFYWYAVFCFLDLVFFFLLAILILRTPQRGLNRSRQC